jgi:chromosome segregation ATPase
LKDLRRRLRILWLWAARLRLRRALFLAEAELGWLGWEQAEFYDEQIAAEVRKVQEFENTQASIQNTSAELSDRKGALDQEHAREKTLHDQTLESLAKEREPIAAQLQQAETSRRQKTEALDRFDHAVEEIGRLERELEARSLDFMNVERPTIDIRAEAREVSDALARLVGERALVLADRATAAQELAAHEAAIIRLRGELQRIDSASATARDALGDASRRLTGEMRLLDRKQRKTSLHMAHLDRKKQQPYRYIGACLADHGIAPLNQPQILQQVFTLRDRDFRLAETLTELRAACAGADPAILIAFYLLLACLLFALSAIVFHFL